MNCRHCNQKLKDVFIDLINTPPSNSYLKFDQLNEAEIFYPLKVLVCSSCFLVQIDEYKSYDSIFSSDYAYFSSYSTSWLDHSKRYAEMVIDRFGLNSESNVLEIASNDGYLLQFFKQKSIPVLGVEPTSNTAKIAISKGIDTLIEFFGAGCSRELLSKGYRADLIVANNVLAHVPDINDFIRGLKLILSSKGVITLEFPHLVNLVDFNQFDTIYHEHFSYLSLFTVKKMFESHGLKVFDVERLNTHGGSLRVYAKHAENSFQEIQESVEEVITLEKHKGVNSLEYYRNFESKVQKIKYDLLTFLLNLKNSGKSIIAYGAAAKGNTLLNYCGIKKDLIEFVVDKNPSKQGKYLPGSHIPIYDESIIEEFKPDFILILPWNLQSEILDQLKYVKNWDCKFIIPIPELKII